MNATLSPRVAVASLLVIAVVFGSNHIAARVSFDHGTSVATAVFARTAGTAVALLGLMRLMRVPVALPPPTILRGMVIGLLVALQSFCIFSAVARIPVALALLALNLFPMLLALATWAFDGVRPSNRALVAMPLALGGLALALDLLGRLETVSGRWQEIGTGVIFGIGAAVTFAMALYFTRRWLKEVDGRVRAFLTTGFAALAILAVAWPGDAFVLPQDPTGWTALVLLTVFYGTAITALFIIQPMPGVARYTAAMNFEPIAVLFMAWPILGQSVTPLQILGAFIVIGAVILLTPRK